jgi:hypothetical protein
MTKFPGATLVPRKRIIRKLANDVSDSQPHVLILDTAIMRVLGL